MAKGAAARGKAKAKAVSKITKAKDAGCSVNNNGNRTAKVKTVSNVTVTNEPVLRTSLRKRKTPVKLVDQSVGSGVVLPSKRRRNQATPNRSRFDDMAKLTPKSKLGSTVNFEEDNNYVSMEVSGLISEQYPSDPEDGEVLDTNNTVEQNSQTSQISSCSRSTGRKARSQTPIEGNASSPTESEDSTSQTDGDSSSESESSDLGSPVPKPGMSEASNIEETLDLMQRFMIEKGLIHKPMSGDQMKRFIQRDERPKTSGNFNSNNVCRRTEHVDQDKAGKHDQDYQQCEQGTYKSPSDMTVYRNAVELIDNRNLSSSSEDAIDTSDENLNKDLLSPEFVNTSVMPITSISIGHSPSKEHYHDDRPHQPRRGEVREREYHNGEDRPPEQISLEDQAERLIRQAERGKAKMLNIPGNVMSSSKDNVLLHSVLIDEGYLSVAGHIDESLKKRILQFEYIDFARLLPNDRVIQEDDNRLTLINKGGTPYLIPANETTLGITSYGKWDQAFRIFSDVITSRYPGEAHELIQYNHVIHTASQTYIWDNVYMYDKDFRIHISRNPSHSWAVILQQSWTMRMKDRHNHTHNRTNSNGANGNNGTSKEYCRRFQRGQCHLGLLRV